MALPIPGKPITCAFGVKGPRWSSGKHEGIDVAVPVGTPYFAPIDGTIVKVGQCWGAAYGQHAVLMKIGSGPLKGKHIVFGHGSSYSVKVGDKVAKGAPLGKTGAEGNVSGPHLHMEIQDGPGWKKASGIDPKPVLEA